MTEHSDYRRIARAIRFLAAHYDDQPSLEEIAGQVDLSPWHFQRTFREWAGVTPKRFVQYLTLEHAKTRLRDAASVMEASWDAGLSGPGRLHDLFVTVEAVTPGEYKTGGEGVTLRWGIVPSPFGDCLVAMTDRGLCRLRFVEEDDRQRAPEELAAEWPEAELVEDPEAAAEAADRAFRLRGGEEEPLRLHLRGTNFQVRVWEALLAIPPGSTVSYGDVARAVGRPGASRAVGNAVGANPVAVLIPCHRVLREDGALGGYRWGVDRKRALLGWEASRVDTEAPDPAGGRGGVPAAGPVSGSRRPAADNSGS